MPEIVKIKEDPSFRLLCRRRWRSCVVFFCLAVLPFIMIFTLAMCLESTAVVYLLERDNRHVWYLGGLLMFYFLSLSAMHVFVANNYHEDTNTQVEFVLKDRGDHY